MLSFTPAHYNTARISTQHAVTDELIDRAYIQLATDCDLDVSGTSPQFNFRVEVQRARVLLYARPGSIAVMLHLVFATGTEPGKWFQRFQRDIPHGIDAVAVDDPFAALADDAGAVGAGGAGPAELALMRLPDARVDETAIGQQFHVVKLYTEQRGIAVPKDSVFAEVGEPVGPADIDGEIINFVAEECGPINVDKLRESLQVVAANVGVAIGPLPLLKMLSKNQISVLPYNGEYVGDSEQAGEHSGGKATVPQTEIALVWKVAEDGDAIQDFVGIAKGRKSGSTRHRAVKESRQKGRKKDGQKSVGKHKNAKHRGNIPKHAGKGARPRGQAPGGARKKKRQ